MLYAVLFYLIKIIIDKYKRTAYIIIVLLIVDILFEQCLTFFMYGIFHLYYTQKWEWKTITKTGISDSMEWKQNKPQEDTV